MKRRAFILLCLVMLAFPLPSRALAAAPSLRLIVGAEDDNALQGSTVRPSSGLLDVSQWPPKTIKKLSIKFTWKIAGKNHTQVVRTDSAGFAHLALKVGNAPLWSTIVVRASTTYKGKTYRGSTSLSVVTHATQAHPVTVRIGVPVPLSAGATDWGAGVVRAVKLAVAQANETTAVQGACIRFQVVSKDDKGDPAQALAVAKSLVADPRVLAVVGPLNSGCVVRAGSVYSSADVPVVTPSASNPGLTMVDSNVVRTIYPDTEQGAAAARIAYDRGLRKAYVLDDGTVYGGRFLANPFAAEFQELGGEVVGRQSVEIQPDDDIWLSGFGSAIAGAGPDVVYWGGLYNGSDTVQNVLAEYVPGVPMFGGDELLASPYTDFDARAGDLATMLGYPAAHLPDGVGFVAAFSAAYPGVAMTDADAYAYDAARAAIAGITERGNGQAGYLGTPMLRSDLLGYIRAQEFSGATGPVSFDQWGERTGSAVSVYRIADGEWVYDGTNIVAP